MFRGLNYMKLTMRCGQLSIRVRRDDSGGFLVTVCKRKEIVHQERYTHFEEAERAWGRLGREYIHTAIELDEQAKIEAAYDDGGCSTGHCPIK